MLCNTCYSLLWAGWSFTVYWCTYNDVHRIKKSTSSTELTQEMVFIEWTKTEKVSRQYGT